MVQENQTINCKCDELIQEATELGILCDYCEANPECEHIWDDGVISIDGIFYLCKLCSARSDRQ